MPSKGRYLIQMNVQILDEKNDYKEVYRYTQMLRDDDSEQYRKFQRKDSVLNYVKRVITMIRPLIHSEPTTHGGE